MRRQLSTSAVRLTRKYPPEFPDEVKGKRPLTVEEGLYLAKEAGFFTKHELQKMIVRSPPFSPRERPFLLENFFDVPRGDPRGDQTKDHNNDEDQQGKRDLGPDNSLEEPTLADPVIHGTIGKYFRRGAPAKFVHNNQEWLAEAEGRGTRKRASAHAVIRRGSGVIKINGETQLYYHWPLIYHRFDVCQPFKYTGTAGVYDVFVETKGGGVSGQSGATRLAIARALLMANPACHDALQRGFCLLEDTRQKMSKMPGKVGARASWKWNKR